VAAINCDWVMPAIRLFATAQAFFVWRDLYQGAIVWSALGGGAPKAISVERVLAQHKAAQSGAGRCLLKAAHRTIY
jgi:hypothetical protein